MTSFLQPAMASYFKKVPSLQGLLYYQPKQCILGVEIPQSYHTFVLFDPPKTGNFMTTAIINLPQSNVNQCLGRTQSFLIDSRHRFHSEPLHKFTSMSVLEGQGKF